MTVYLYDSQGMWIAYRLDHRARHLFAPDGDWIGWFAWDDDDAVTPAGEYLGTVVGDRLLIRVDRAFRGTPDYPGAPTYPGRASYPGAAPFVSVPPGFDDVPGAHLRSRLTP